MLFMSFRPVMDESSFVIRKNYQKCSEPAPYNKKFSRTEYVSVYKKDIRCIRKLSVVLRKISSKQIMPGAQKALREVFIKTRRLLCTKKWIPI